MSIDTLLVLSKVSNVVFATEHTSFNRGSYYDRGLFIIRLLDYNQIKRKSVK